MNHFLLLISPIWSYYLAGRLTEMYRQRGIVRHNYRGLPVPPSLGPALLLGILPAMAMIPDLLLVYATAMVYLGFSFFGLWDDLLVERVTGFKGHLGAFYRGKLTAGMLKIITALLVASLFVLYLPGGLAGRLLGLLLILLSANGFNLLDRRPGRAIKVFFAAALLLLFTVPAAAASTGLLLPVVAAGLALAPLDLDAEAMLGDCGSNLLGASLGVTLVLNAGLKVQVAAVVFWLVLHIYAEFASISVLIEKLPFLRFLDRLGRYREKIS